MLGIDVGGFFQDLIGHPKEVAAAQQGQIALAESQTQIAALQLQSNTERNRAIMIVVCVLIVMFTLYLVFK